MEDRNCFRLVLPKFLKKAIFIRFVNSIFFCSGVDSLLHSKLSWVRLVQFPVNKSLTESKIYTWVYSQRPKSERSDFERC